jgi:hypothetical protein
MKYRALIPIESRLEGVDRRKLKFTTLNTLQAGVSIRANVKSGREGKTNQPRSKADEYGDLFYQGSVVKNLDASATLRAPQLPSPCHSRLLRQHYYNLALYKR